MKQIFPKEIIENTAEVHRFLHSTKSKVIYTIVLLSIIGSFAAMPFLTVNVYTSARGIIKPNKERISLKVINSGRIVYSNIVNNQKVTKGDTLLVIDDNGVQDQLIFSEYRISETSSFIKDLSLLLENGSVRLNDLQSSKYQRDLGEFEQKMAELSARYKKIKLDFDRHQLLYNKGVIAESEFENKQLEYDLAAGDIRQFKKQRKNSWQTDLTQNANLLKEIESNKEQLIKNQSQFVVTAPINGTLLDVKAQELGIFISAGTQLGEISPDSELLAECYVSPSDIALLKKDTPINFQIDAYNYNQWGLVTGQVTEIGKDIEMFNNQPVFKVRCKLNESFLQLKNGFQGDLKKGMTLNANFELAERSLFDLLYDKMDDWLNPSQKIIVKR